MTGQELQDCFDWLSDLYVAAVEYTICSDENVPYAGGLK